MNVRKVAPFKHIAVRLLMVAGICASSAIGQTVLTQTTVVPISPTTPVSVGIFSENLFQASGVVSNNITPLTFGSGIRFQSNTPGLSDPGLLFNGTITGSSIAPGTVLPISYAFAMSKNSSAGATVSWSLTFSDDVNTTPVIIGSGTLSSDGPTSFSGSNTYHFTSGASSSFSAALQVIYAPGEAFEQPEVRISMANTGFGGDGITLGGSAVPEPSTYAALAGLSMLVFVAWRRRQLSR